MDARIVYTSHAGGVAVCVPSRSCLAWMACGGRWGDKPHGYIDTQIERQIAAGHHADAARRFARALACGGCTEAEALAIIRDRDCVHRGTGCELWDAADVPSDRTYRDAWRRSPNGGPIYVAMSAARRIQWGRIKKAVELHNKPRLALGRKPLAPLWGELGNAIRHARDEDELRRVWPGALSPNAIDSPALASVR